MESAVLAPVHPGEQAVGFVAPVGAAGEAGLAPAAEQAGVGQIGHPGLALGGAAGRPGLEAGLAHRPTFLTCDVSFISLALVLPALTRLAAPSAALVALIKPQFEVGRAAIGKGGIVRDANAVADALSRIDAALAGLGWQAMGRIDSPIAGGDGNAEFLIAARRGPA